jgi:undecaprenyl-diphosphatase
MDPISYFQAIVLGLLQGVSELFPISSLGHSVVLPRVFGWNIHQNDDYFLSFLVATHCATAIVLFFFFLKDWVQIIKGLGRSLRDRYIGEDDTYAKLGWLLVVATVPAGLLGLLLEHPLRSLFASTQTAAIFLFVNGLMLFGAEALRRRAPVRSEQGMHSDEVISRTLSFRSAIGIGTAQALALIPGLSRSGASMGGGLLSGLSNEEAARFAFLLATPIIGAAGLLKLPELLGHQGDHVRGQALVGAIAAGIAAYFSVKFLLRFFETNRLTPFAIYCCVVGAVLSVAFALS